MGFDPHRLWQIVRRRRFYLILPVIVIGVVLGVGVSTLSPVYVASTRILLEDRSTGTDVDKIMTQEARRVRDMENLVVVRETLMSEELLTRVIRNLHLRDDPAVLEQARMLQQEALPDQTIPLIAERILVNRLRRKLYVGGREGNLFVISMEDNDPYTAYKLTEAATQAFIDEMSRRRVEGLIETTSFTDEQLETARKDLREAEKKLEEFKRTRLIQETLSDNPVNEDNSRQAASVLQTTQLDIRENEREIQRLDAQLRSCPQPLPSRLDGILNDPQVRNIRERLAVLERADYQGILANPKAPSSGITIERQRIGIQRNRLSERIHELVKADYPDLDETTRQLLERRAELRVVNEVLKAHEAQIRREYDSYQNRIKSQPSLEAELRRLEQEVKNNEDIYNRLISAETSNELRLAANESGFGYVVHILEPARKPLAPEKPDKKKVALMGIMLALGIGVGAVFLAEYVDTSFKDVEDVERILDLPVVGTLPRFADDYQWSKKKKRTVYAWRTAFVVTLVTAMVLFVLYYRNSLTHDQIHLVHGVSESMGSSAQEDSP